MDGIDTDAVFSDMVLRLAAGMERRMSTRAKCQVTTRSNAAA